MRASVRSAINPSYLKDFVRFAYLTGWRKGEVAQLTWDDVDRKGKTIRLHPEGSKTAKGRTIALTGELWELIEQWCKAREQVPWVFHIRTHHPEYFRPL